MDKIKFQSTLPARGATVRRQPLRRVLRISIHAPRTGSDALSAVFSGVSENFNPRSPHGERRQRVDCYKNGFQISIHAPRTGSDGIATRQMLPRRISIHAPRTGSDGVDLQKISTGKMISIHAPRTGSDVQSRHSALAGAISIHAPRTGSDINEVERPRIGGISIHAPRTGSDMMYQRLRHSARISIHAPRTGSDALPIVPLYANDKFQSTLPARGATEIGGIAGNGKNISIHAPRTGSDPSSNGLIWVQGISIHAPRTGSDSSATGFVSSPINFNPRSPHGERL